MRGIFVLTDKSLPHGAGCDVSLFLSGLEDRLELKLKGIVHRVTEAGIGFKFTEIDVDSYSRLKNLVMLNASSLNVVKIENEITGRRENMKDGS